MASVWAVASGVGVPPGVARLMVTSVPAGGVPVSVARLPVIVMALPANTVAGALRVSRGSRPGRWSP